MPIWNFWLREVIERVVLIGFMCSGKSTVGRILAAKLDWEFLDFDEVIELEQDRTIAEIFRDEGETFFRELEQGLTHRIQSRRNLVLAPGGGWVTQPYLLDRMRPGSLTVWLRVEPSTVVERHRRQSDAVRPLLSSQEPQGRIEALLAARTPLYKRADLVIDTDGRTREDIAEDIAQLVASWPINPEPSPGSC